MTNQEICDRALEEYNEALEDHTYVDRYEAAYNCAINSITADVWKKYGVKTPLEASQIKGIKQDISTILANFILTNLRRELEIEL